MLWKPKGCQGERVLRCRCWFCALCFARVAVVGSSTVRWKMAVALQPSLLPLLWQGTAVPASWRRRPCRRCGQCGSAVPVGPSHCCIKLREALRKITVAEAKAHACREQTEKAHKLHRLHNLCWQQPMLHLGLMGLS
jgi:hypothetical protein